MPERTTEIIFKTLCTGGSPPRNDLIQFCKEATDEQLRISLTKTNELHVRERGLIEEELEGRRHKELTKHLGNVSSHLVELKKPHPLLWWTFRISFAALIVGILALILNYLQWQFPKSSVGANKPPMLQPPSGGDQLPASKTPGSGPVTAPTQPK